MKTSVKLELAHHILERINDGVIDDANKDYWHFYCFNEDYYIIGYYQAEQWLKNHDISAFEAIGICQEYENEVFGEHQKVYDNAETTVNMLAYIYGEQILNEIDADNIEDLTEALNDIVE